MIRVLFFLTPAKRMLETETAVEIVLERETVSHSSSVSTGEHHGGVSTGERHWGECQLASRVRQLVRVCQLANGCQLASVTRECQLARLSEGQLANCDRPEIN